MGDLRVDIIKDSEQFQNMADDWNALLFQSKCSGIFLTWEWLYTWSEVFLGKGRSLFILAVREKEELVGLAPWYLSRFKVGPLGGNEIVPLGHPETAANYLDVIVKLGCEKEVANCLYDFLYGDAISDWDRLMLPDQLPNSLFFLHFTQRLERAGKYFSTERGSCCPILLLPSSKDDFLSGLSANKRAQFRKHLKRLEKEGGVIHSSFTGEKADLQVGFDRFSSLYSRKPEREEGLLLFLQKFVSRCQRGNWIHIDILSSGNRDVAAAFHLRYHNKMLGYILATDKEFNQKVSVGNVLIKLCIEKAIDERLLAYDFLTGAEDYKFSWVNDVNVAVDILVPQKRPAAFLGSLTRFTKDSAKILLR